MRVLQIVPVFIPDIGGVNTHLWDLCRFLSEVKKYKVFVITFKPYSKHLKWIKKERINNNLTVRRYWWIVGHFWDVIEKYPFLSFLNIATGLTFYSLIHAFYNRKSFDVIHAHGLNAAFAGKFIKYFFKKKLIVSIHAYYNFKNRKLLGKIVKWVLRDADKILTLSNQTAQEYLDLGLEKQKVGRFTYWVDQQKFQPLPQNYCRKQLELGGAFTSIFVGRFIPKKGIEIIVRLAKEIPHINFLMVGGGLMENYLEKKVKGLKNLYLFKNIPNDKLPLFYNAADVCIIPSLYDEGFGRVILEALSCGVPVIASNMGGIKEALDEKVGVLVTPTYRNFKKTLLFLYKNKNKWLSFKRNTVKFARKYYSIKNAEDIAGYYQ